MPIYEFLCRACGHVFEIMLWRLGYDITQIRCPRCESHDVERRWSSVFAITSKKS